MSIVSNLHGNSHADLGDHYTDGRQSYQVSRSQYARIPIFKADETKDGESGGGRKVLGAIFSIVAIGGSIALMYNSSEARECAAAAVLGLYC